MFQIFIVLSPLPVAIVFEFTILIAEKIEIFTFKEDIKNINSDAMHHDLKDLIKEVYENLSDDKLTDPKEIN